MACFKADWVHLCAFSPLMVGFLWNICIAPDVFARGNCDCKARCRDSCDSKQIVQLVQRSMWAKEVERQGLQQVLSGNTAHQHQNAQHTESRSYSNGAIQYWTEAGPQLATNPTKTPLCTWQIAEQRSTAQQGTIGT